LYESDSDQQGTLDDDVAAQLAQFELLVEKVGPYTSDEFRDLWGRVEKGIGYSTQDIEKGSLVREANTRLRKEDTTEQERAQYGRFEFKAMKVRCSACTSDCRLSYS
jgi:predicted transcriptional regulator